MTKITPYKVSRTPSWRSAWHRHRRRAAAYDDGSGRSARTAAPNSANVSNTASVTIVGDTTPPTVSITSPTGGNVSNNATLTASATDNVGVQSVQFKLDGQDLGNPDTAAPYSITWDTRTATDGTHTLTAVARAASGNARRWERVLPTRAKPTRT